MASGNNASFAVPRETGILIRVEKSGGLLPDVVFRMRVLDAKLSYGDMKVQHTAGVGGDPMIAHYLLHAGERSHNLDEITRAELGHENISIKALIGTGKKQITMEQAIE